MRLQLPFACNSTSKEIPQHWLTSVKFLTSLLVWPSVAMAQPRFFSETGHCVPNKISKILKIFKGVEGAKGQGACFSTKELDDSFLGYSHGFDLEPRHEPDQSNLNNPGMDDPIP